MEEYCMFLLSLKKAKSILLALIFCFIANIFLPYSGYAAVLPYMPQPGTMIALSEKADLPLPVGIEFRNNNPFDFNFVLSRTGNNDTAFLRAQAETITKYFFAALTMPAEDLWVNLSPYEQDRISTEALAQTELGKDLLGEDYVLKQLASSLTYPESESGKAYWNQINNVGANNCSPVNNFNKVWIVPGEMLIEESSGKARVAKAELKVMCEEDYLACRHAYRQAGQAGLAMQKNGRFDTSRSLSAKRIETNGTLSDRANQSFKTHILPSIEQEVNQGRRFAHLRQIYYAVMLAGWFKRKLHDTVLSQTFFDKNKIQGASNDDPAIREKIYHEYVKAFQTGVYNYVKKERVGANDYSPVKKITRRQYFSGGAEMGAAADAPIVSVLDAATFGSRAHVEAESSGMSEIDLTKHSTAESLVQGIEAWVEAALQQNGELFRRITLDRYELLDIVQRFYAEKVRSVESVNFRCGYAEEYFLALDRSDSGKVILYLRKGKGAAVALDSAPIPEKLGAGKPALASASRADSSVGGAKIDNTLTAGEALLLGQLVQGWLKEQLRLIRIESDFVSELWYEHDDNILAAAQGETVVKTDVEVDSAIMGTRTRVTYKIVNGALAVTLSVPGHEPAEKLFLRSDIKITTEDTFLFASAVQDWADDLYASAAWRQNTAVGDLRSYGINGAKQLIDQAMARPGEAVRAGADPKSPTYYLFDAGKLTVHVELERGYAQTAEISLGDIRFCRGLSKEQAKPVYAPAPAQVQPLSNEQIAQGLAPRIYALIADQVKEWADLDPSYRITATSGLTLEDAEHQSEIALDGKIASFRISSYSLTNRWNLGGGGTTDIAGTWSITKTSKGWEVALEMTGWPGTGVSRNVKDKLLVTEDQIRGKTDQPPAPASPVSPDLLREAEDANRRFGDELRFFRDLFDQAAGSHARFAPPAGGRRYFSRGRRPSQSHGYQPYQRDDVSGKRDVPMAGKGWRVVPAKSVSTPASAPVMVSTPGQLVNAVREECRRVPDILRYDIPQKYEPFVRGVLAKGDKGSDSFSVKGHGVQLTVDGAKAYLIITKPNGTSRKYSYTLGFRSSVVAHVPAPQAAKPAASADIPPPAATSVPTTSAPVSGPAAAATLVPANVEVIPPASDLSPGYKQTATRAAKEAMLLVAGQKSVPEPVAAPGSVQPPAPASDSFEARVAREILRGSPLVVKNKEHWGKGDKAMLVDGTSSEADITRMLKPEDGAWRLGQIRVARMSGDDKESIVTYPLRVSRISGKITFELGFGNSATRQVITIPANSAGPRRASYGDVDRNNAKQIDKGLEYFFQEARRVLGIQGKRNLTEDECDRAVILLLRQEGKNLLAETLRTWRAVAKAQGGLEGRKVFFPLAYDLGQRGWSQCLWYARSSNGEIQRAAGHYSLPNNSVYISVQAILAVLHDDRAIIVSRIAQYESLRFIDKERDLDSDDQAYLDHCQRVDKKTESDRTGSHQTAMARRVTVPVLGQEHTVPNDVSQLLASTPIAKRVTSGVPMIVATLDDPPASLHSTRAFAEAAGYNGYGVIAVTQYNFGSDPKNVVVPADSTIKSADDLASQFHDILHHWVGNMLNVANPGLYAKNGGFNDFRDARVIFKGQRGEIRLAFGPGIRAGLVQAMKTGEPVAATIILPQREKSSEAITVNMVFVPYLDKGDLVVTLADGPFFPAGGNANSNSFTMRALMKRVGNDRREAGGVKLGAAASGENIQTQSNGSAFTLDAGWCRPGIKGVRFSIVEVVP